MAQSPQAHYARRPMARIGTRIEESGTLVHAGNGLLFRRELGGRWNIEGWPKAELELGKPGRLVGTVIDDETVAIERFTTDD